MNTGNKPYKIFRPLFQTKDLLLRIHVVLNDENNNAHEEYEFNKKIYTKINPKTFLTLEIKKQDEQFDPTASMLIGRGTQCIFEKAFDRLLANIYTNDIFANKGNTIIAYQDMVEKFSEKIMIPRSNTGVIITPAVIYDENDISYEGVTFFINRTSNTASLTISEFEEFVYTFKKIDLFSYSQLIMNYYASVYGAASQQPQTNNKQNHYANKIDWSMPKQEPQTASNFRKETDNIFSGIKESR